MVRFFDFLTQKKIGKSRFITKSGFPVSGPNDWGSQKKHVRVSVSVPVPVHVHMHFPRGLHQCDFVTSVKKMVNVTFLTILSDLGVKSDKIPVRLALQANFTCIYGILA